MLQGNRKHAQKYHQLYEGLVSGQSPDVVVAFCSDSRLQTDIFGKTIDAVNKLFVGRDIGNTLIDNQGAIDYALLHLGVPLLFILGHTACGAAKAACCDYSQEPESIKSRLAHLHVPADEITNPQCNVDSQVDLAVEKYQERVKEGKLLVIGGIFDLTGAYGGLAGKIYLTNVNGLREEDPIKRKLKEAGVKKKLLEEMVKRVSSEQKENLTAQ